MKLEREVEHGHHKNPLNPRVDPNRSLKKNKTGRWIQWEKCSQLSFAINLKEKKGNREIFFFPFGIFIRKKK